MISSLPPELLALIIESTVPHTFHSTTYRDRQRTLRSLSLVSKTFHSIAQPLLLEIVWIQSPEQIDLVQTGSRFEQPINHRDGISWLAVGHDEAYLEDARAEKQMLEQLAKRFSSLSHFSWRRASEPGLDLSSLSSLRRKLSQVPVLLHFRSITNVPISRKDLSTLQLSHLEADVWDPPSLVNLRSLCIYRVSPSIMITLLDPTIVPNLRHFALVDPERELVEYLNTSKLVHLLPQLHVLSFEIDAWTSPELTFSASIADRTLVDCSFFDFYLQDRVSNIKHARIYDSYREGDELGGTDLCEVLDQFSKSLQRNSYPSLRSLYLDDSLRPGSPLPLEAALLVAKVVTSCRELNVEVIFEPVPRDCTLNPFISTEFVRRQEQSRSYKGDGARKMEGV